MWQTGNIEQQCTRYLLYRCMVAVSRGHGDFGMLQGRTPVQGYGACARAFFSLTPIEAYTCQY